MLDIKIYKQKFLGEKQEWETKYLGLSHTLDDICIESCSKGETLKELAGNLLTILDLNIDIHNGTLGVDYAPNRSIEVHGLGNAVKKKSLNFIERTLFEYYLKKVMKKRQNKEE